MARLMAVAMLASISFDTHHVHGVHDGKTAHRARSVGRSIALPTAFQCCKTYRNKPPASSQLRYSSDEGGVHNWLPPKEALLVDDAHLAENVDDPVAAGFWEGTEYEGAGDNAILDDWANNARERRSRRLQTLEKFNQDSTSEGDVKRRAHQGRNYARSKTSAVNLELPYNDLTQLQAIQSNAPAILLPSGPGTGKSRVLALRIAYLLQRHILRKQSGAPPISDTDPTDRDECTPDSMVIMSFTNKDAERLKERALDYLFRQNGDSTAQLRNETSKQLWAGTMHAFSLAILQKYGSTSQPLRVLPAKQMRSRVSASLRSLLSNGEVTNRNSKDVQSRHVQALNDVGQSRSILYQNIVRCIELWKEANIPLTTPEPSSSVQRSEGDTDEEDKVVRVRKACLELAKRLGSPKSSALLALDVYPEYQARHASAGTADPSDLAGMAYSLLIEQPKSLHLLRSKLKHLIVDEYQDMSVSQHALLRLIVRGGTDEDKTSMTTAGRKKRQAEQRRRRKLPVLLEPRDRKRKFKATVRPKTALHPTYSVPSIFCAGDASQSIYGWRGGAPELTVHGFLRDYPQGVIAPLGTCYRLPNDIVEAAATLLPNHGFEGSVDAGLSESTSYEPSPAAAAALASSLVALSAPNAKYGPRIPSAEEKVRLGNELLLSKGMQKIDSTVIIHGLWDSREEAKYIASTIRRRSKERRKALISSLSKLDVSLDLDLGKGFLDSTDVAVMVRSSHQLYLIKEALDNAGVPFVADGNNEGDMDRSWMPQRATTAVKTVQMKPATVITMHRSKGEEFDDVYLAGWTEGEFPHPEAVSSNRVHEERRLAYVALTRARQRVVITHSFMKRVLHYGKSGRKKYVTGQVEPSRFLYEIVPTKGKEDGAISSSGEGGDSPCLPSSDNKGIMWDRSSGIKELVAGQNLPDFFQKSYQQPRGSVAKRSDLRRFSSVVVAPQSDNPVPKDASPSSKETDSIPKKSPLDVIEEGLKELVARKKGASSKYTPIFKGMLASFFQIKRGKALVFASGARSHQTQNASVQALLQAPADQLTKKPLGKCTAIQLGHYLAYLILNQKQSPPIERPELPPADANELRGESNRKQSHEEALEVVAEGLNSITVNRTKGASGKYAPIFKEMLASLFQIKRGKALIFASGARSQQAQNESVSALVDASHDELVEKPLGKCTATQLGHYLGYLILTTMKQAK